MQELCIHGAEFSTVEEIHEFLQNELDFPAYYGGNLSALYDMLTEQSEDMKVIFSLRECLPDIYDYLERMVQVFLDAQEENSYLEVEVEE